ncbi:hypothetical protein [Brevibacterium pigmentatum]|uniref:hypothetical protein n=1 Tax=Brevibacterium pigmentatum TaxID=1496080 RepID=UPI001420F87B|nr:hypothetical protein [Brevibacterium pigmentatum]
MSDAESDLAALVRAEVERQMNPFQIMQVSSVREDGKVNLQWGETIINDVAANQAYNPRAEGDVVLVLQHSAGWRVMDKIGGPVEVDIPEPVDLTFGDGLPAGDFVQVNSVFMKDGAIYGLIGEGPAPGPGEPPRKSKPKPVTLDPASTAAYRDGRRDGSRPAQGAWPSYPHPYSSVFLYGSRIAAACEGKTVDSMQIRVARTSKYHGVSGKVRPRLGLHDETSPPSKTPKLTNRWDGPGLGMGDSKWITIPASQAARLASGASRGVGIGAGTGKSNYMIATEGSGNLRIKFKT